MLSFIGKFPLPPLHALPRLFFSSHSQVIRPSSHPPPQGTRTPLSQPLSPLPSPLFLSQTPSARSRLWGAAGGREGGGVPGVGRRKGPKASVCTAPGGLPRSTGALLQNLGRSLLQRARLTAKGGGRGKSPRGASRHILVVSRSHLRPPSKSGLLRRPHISGPGRGKGTAPSCQTGGLLSEKAICRARSGGGAQHWFRTQALVPALVLGGLWAGSTSFQPSLALR